jgi:hypothetical protein
LAIAPTPLDDVIREFFGDEDQHEFATLTPDAQDRGIILATNFTRAREALDTKRQRFLSDFGLQPSGEVNPAMRFGAFQNQLREGGRILDSFEGLSAARGFEAGSGLARAGASAARASVDDQRDQLDTARIDTLADFGQQRLRLGEDIKLDLIDTKVDDQRFKIESEGFTPTPEDVPDGSEFKEEAPVPTAAAVVAGSKAAKAGKFARRRLIAARRAGIRIGAIPKDPSRAAAKWRRVSGRLTPAQQRKLKKQLGGK